MHRAERGAFRGGLAAPSSMRALGGQNLVHPVLAVVRTYARSVRAMRVCVSAAALHSLHLSFYSALRPSRLGSFSLATVMADGVG